MRVRPGIVCPTCGHYMDEHELEQDDQGNDLPGTSVCPVECAVEDCPTGAGGSLT